MKFFNWIGLKGLQKLGLQEDPANKIATGKWKKGVRIGKMGKVIDTWTVEGGFKSQDVDEETAKDLFAWVQEDAYNEFKEIKNGKLQ